MELRAKLMALGDIDCADCDPDISPTCHFGIGQLLCKTSAEQILAAVHAWGEEPCPHYVQDEGTRCYKHACDKCWAELKDKTDGR